METGMRIGAMIALTMALLLAGGVGAANAQAAAGSAEAASAPQAAPGKATANPANAGAPVARPSSTEKSQAAITDSSPAPRSPNAPK